MQIKTKNNLYQLSEGSIFFEVYTYLYEQDYEIKKSLFYDILLSEKNTSSYKHLLQTDFEAYLGYQDLIKHIAVNSLNEKFITIVETQSYYNFKNFIKADVIIKNSYIYGNFRKIGINLHVN